MARNAHEFHPVTVLYDGKLSASIYRRIDQHGPLYSVEFNRSGYCQGIFVTSKFFREEHLLSLKELAQRAYACVADFKNRDAEYWVTNPTRN
ncbi:hypothetical protein NHH03_23590 [Stieleria sp. TO1_6]|uniref:hypothetical protein n=1 Tax=Stieleria tagensis TaxID=2956795 RepID=UPI00209ACB5A|nr:hypothetical protein [Stieleria tagensis]MCO8124741.1 hypothetical protein [Stieleria tagensis]